MRMYFSIIYFSDLLVILIVSPAILTGGFQGTIRSEKGPMKSLFFEKRRLTQVPSYALLNPVINKCWYKIDQSDAIFISTVKYKPILLGPWWHGLH